MARIQLKILTFLVFAFVLVFGQSSADAQTLYVVRGSRGVMTFTSRKPEEGSSYKVFSARGPTFSRFYSLRLPWRGKPIKSRFDDLIVDESRAAELDPHLVKALVHVESSFDPSATSPKGAMGLMQLMPGTASRMGVEKPYRPEQNVRGGVKYLKMLFERYNGNHRLALAAYNAGEGAVDRFSGIPPYAETQTYVRRVMQLWELYGCAEGGRKNCKAS